MRAVIKHIFVCSLHVVMHVRVFLKECEAHTHAGVPAYSQQPRGFPPFDLSAAFPGLGLQRVIGSDAGRKL